VEDLLCAHPGIADAAVIGMPDKEVGEGASKLLIPERFEFVDTLPRTAAGKHDKKASRRDIKQKFGIVRVPG
jgi:non-ribosomal peptide synthetase component E (peptide arylation enzyme)